MNPTLLGFLKKEFLQVLREPKMRILVFAVPIVQMGLFGLAISTEVKNIRLAVNFSPNDEVTRRISEHAFASQWFVPAKISKTLLNENPTHWIQADQADAVLIAPPEGLSRAISRGDAKLQLLVDGTNNVRAQSVERYLQSIVNQELSDATQLPLNFDVRILYNPAMVTAVFMVPGVLCMVLCVITVLLTSMAMAREKEIGTFETLVAAPIRPWEILLGKTIPYVVLGMVDVPLVLSVAIFFFGVPQKGPLWLLGLASFAFICTTVSIGFLISTLAKNQQQAMMGSFLFLFPGILLSGIMYPVENMPKIISLFAHADPLKYFVTLLRNIMLKGGDLEVATYNTLILVGIALFAAWGSYSRFNKMLR